MLHHLATFGEPLRPVIDRSHRSALGMRQLQHNHIVCEAPFIERRVGNGRSGDRRCGEGPGNSQPSRGHEGPVYRNT